MRQSSLVGERVEGMRDRIETARFLMCYNYRRREEASYKYPVMIEWYWLFPFFIALHLWIVPLCAIFFHRVYSHGQAHTTPVFDDMARICLWLTYVSGPFTPTEHLRYWAAMHRKHHTWSDTELDPHSPHFYSYRDVILYPKCFGPGQAYCISEQEARELAPEIPDFDDRIENFMRQYRYLNWLPLCAGSTLLFGWAGAVAAMIMMWLWYIWPRLFNAISHRFGYRHQEPRNTGDRSRNLWPIGIVFGGDDLAANHHDYPYLPNCALRSYEFDLGYVWMRLYQYFGLLEIQSSARLEPTPKSQ